MKAWLAVVVNAVLLAGTVFLTGTSPLPDTVFQDVEIRTILSHGPWPPPWRPDPSNRVSGQPSAIALGRRLFFDTRLSRSQEHSCATCHIPAKTFTDGLERSLGTHRVDRNASALLNMRWQRWFGWDGAADSVWAQTLRPLLDERELAITAELLASRLAVDAAFASAYIDVFGTPIAATPPDTVLVNVAKALAAFQETIITGRTAFDAFRDALAQGDTVAMAAYPPAARRGLQIFVGKGRCSLCHFGPHFTNGEFHDIGIPFFITRGQVDKGRYGGIERLKASPYNLLGPYNDDPQRTTATPTRHVLPLHRHWGEFRIPSLRQVAETAPYMHNGSLATLAEVVQHYDAMNPERLHSEGERLLQPLHLRMQEKVDLVSFLHTLSAPLVFLAVPGP